MYEVLVLAFAYLLGCFCTGYYLVRVLKGEDIRDLASGNVGSRNVGRLLGAKGFAVTLVGDAGKGMLAIWLAHYMSHHLWTGFAALLAVTAGHIWPVQLGFRGGKGFATLAGGMVILAPVVFLWSLVLSVLFLSLRRGTTAAGLLALALSPVVMVMDRFYSGTPLFSLELVLYFMLVVMTLYAHRGNIRAALLRN